MPGFADFAGVVEITRLNTSEFYIYLDEPCGNELVFAFSFVSSNNTDVETTEQFILLHTSSETRRKHLRLISYFVYFFGFLAFDPR